jgi:hypothetical protein
LTTIDPEAPINIHPELAVEWEGTATYQTSGTYDSDPFKHEIFQFINDVRHDIKILIRTMIVVASELRHMRYEGVPADIPNQCEAHGFLDCVTCGGPGGGA